MVAKCPKCAHQDLGRGNFCSMCDAPMPLREGEDYFSAFGLDRVLTVDSARLKAAYFDLSRRLHPDAHVGDTSEVQEASLRRSAFLNDAYQALRDPVRRVRYLLSLEGSEPVEGRTTRVANFELMEAIQDAQFHQDPVERETRLQVAETQVMTLRETALRDLDDLGRRWDALGRPHEAPGPREALLEEMQARVDEIGYTDRLLRAVEEVRNPEASGKGNRR